MNVITSLKSQNDTYNSNDKNCNFLIFQIVEKSHIKTFISFRKFNPFAQFAIPKEPRRKKVIKKMSIINHLKCDK